MISRTLRVMCQSRFNRNFLIVTAMMAAVIVFGCLYPFAFRQPADDIGPVHKILESWAEWHGRADFLSNILLYMPFGFFAVLASRSEAGAWRGIFFAVLAGSALSISVELIQYYDEGRTTAAIDAYSNILGSGLGAMAGSVIGGNSRWTLFREMSGRRVPALLLVAWLGYRLFPYLPVIDAHQYWAALQPVVRHPSLTAYDLFRDTAIWLTVGTLVEAVGGQRRFSHLFPLVAGAALVARLVIVGTPLSMAEIVGAGLAFAWLVLAGGTRLSAAVVALLLGAAVVDQRLEPFQFGATAGHFVWIPFLSFMRGSEADVVSFLQKSFLYGSLIWLPTEIGLRLSSSAALVAAALLITSWAESHLPNRSGEITDAVIAVMIAAVIGLMNSAEERKRASGGGKAAESRRS